MRSAFPPLLMIFQAVEGYLAQALVWQPTALARAVASLSVTRECCLTDAALNDLCVLLQSTPSHRAPTIPTRIA